MKNKIILLISTVVALAFISCEYNEKHFDGLDDMTRPTDVKNLEYTLTESDYATLAGLDANKKIARAISIEDSIALAALKTTHAFTDMIPADVYAPAFLANKWFTADNGSAVKLTYNFAGNLPAYITQISNAALYTVSTANYESIWGAGEGINYFTPSVSPAMHIPTFLTEKYPDAEDGDIVHVNYNLADSEPDTDPSYESKAILYTFNGTTWAAYTANAHYVFEKADFATMGSNYDNFSASMAPDDYLPQFLRIKYPYAQDGATIALVYKYFASSVTSIKADEYSFEGGEWIKNNAVEVITDQFVKANDKWMYNPSVTIYLNPVRNEPTIMAYYQAMVDWVWENVDQAELGITQKGKGYVTSYGNNDYYTGASAYYNNVDWRPAKAREQYAAGFEGKTDEEIMEMFKERFIQVLGESLPVLHQDAKYIDGVDITYTVNIAIYTGGSSPSAVTHKMVYKVIADAKFEYVKDSFEAL